MALPPLCFDCWNPVIAVRLVLSYKRTKTIIVRMRHRSLLYVLCSVLCLLSAVPPSFSAPQHEQQVQPPASVEEPLYGRRFFVQLRGVFGRFRDSDLQRAFEKAQPIDCSELINEKGEWRTVAFFNEKRELGDWYRATLEEVKSDLAVFIFKGVCRGDHAPVQLTTKFPVSESIEAFNQQRIPLDQVEVNVNAAVRATFDTRTQAYTFDLPFLFLVGEQDNTKIYSLEPPRLLGRERYATEAIDHWDCKSVTADAVTYQFLICKTTTVGREAAGRNQYQRPAFGASAYFILSDGKEASSSVKLSFGDDNDAKVEDNSPIPNAGGDQGPVVWEAPDSEERLSDVLRDEFRMRFTPQSWTGRIGASQVLTARRLSSLESSNASSSADSCVWLPGDSASANRLLAADHGEPLAYAITARDPEGQSSASVTFSIGTIAGLHIGSLQCFFPRTASAGSVTFGRWKSTVGDALTLEVRQ